MEQQRKTIPVVNVMWSINYFLKNSQPDQVAERKANAALLSMVLHQTGNYKGFRYMELSNAGTPQQSLGDESRRQYYVPAALGSDYATYANAKEEEGLTTDRLVLHQSAKYYRFGRST